MNIVSLAELMALRETWRHEQQRLVLTNGIFDLLHSGHVRYLEQARQLGDVLVVGINSDKSTRTLKGPLRPLIPEDERASIVAALRSVTYVTIFHTPTAVELVEALQPDVYVKGGDYATDDGESQLTVDESRLPEAQSVQAYGGRIILLPYYGGFSTTALIERVLERFQSGG